VAEATARDVVVAHLDHELWRTEVANIAKTGNRCPLLALSGHHIRSRGASVKRRKADIHIRKAHVSF
jgi:hypothetical protein